MRPGDPWPFSTPTFFLPRTRPMLPFRRTSRGGARSPRARSSRVRRLGDDQSFWWRDVKSFCSFQVNCSRIFQEVVHFVFSEAFVNRYRRYSINGFSPGSWKDKWCESEESFCWSSPFESKRKTSRHPSLDPGECFMCEDRVHYRKKGRRVGREPVWPMWSLDTFSFSYQTHSTLAKKHKNTWYQTQSKDYLLCLLLI